MGPPAQLTFDLDGPPRFGREDFLPAPCNADALRTIEFWPAWPDRVLVLQGPPGAGKSHLGAIWAALAAAPVVAAAAVDDGTTEALRRHGALLVEDADRQPFDEPALFHLLDLARRGGQSVLLTARAAPPRWSVTLPDLLSRLRLAPILAIGDPDEALVRAVLVKLMADRQIAVEPHVVDYAARNIGRSLSEVRSFVEMSDRRSLSAGRRITRATAADVLADLALARDDSD